MDMNLDGFYDDSKGNIKVTLNIPKAQFLIPFDVPTEDKIIIADMSREEIVSYIKDGAKTLTA